MALDFTTIKDEPGTAIFLLSDGTVQDLKSMEDLAVRIRKGTRKQVIILPVNETTGRSILEFYHLKGNHFVLLVRDDDQLHHVWSDGDMFDPTQIAYLAEQAG